MEREEQEAEKEKEYIVGHVHDRYLDQSCGR